MVKFTLEIYAPIDHVHPMKLEVETQKCHTLGDMYPEKHAPTQFQTLKG